MKIELDDDLQHFVRQEVTSGRFADEAAVVREALEQMRGAPSWTQDSLRAAVQRGTDQLDRGEVADFDAESVIAEERRLYHQRD